MPIRDIEKISILFFLISKKILLKKRKAPLSTQEVYTGTTQLAQKKTQENPQGTTNPQVTQNTKEAPNNHHQTPKIQ
jgi:hypothetical protein